MLFKRKVIEYLKRNKDLYGFTEIIDFFGIDTQKVFGDGDYDFIGIKDGKKIRFKIVSDIAEAKNMFLVDSIPKKEVVDIIYGKDRFIKTTSGTINLGKNYVWVGEKYVNIYDFSLFDGIVYVYAKDDYSKKWERLLNKHKHLIKLELDDISKVKLPFINYQSIPTFLMFLVRERKGLYWETRFIKKDKGVISDKFHKTLFDLFRHLSKFRLSNANYYIGINPRSEKSKKLNAVKYGNVLFVDMDSERAIHEIDEILDALRQIGLEPSLVGVSGGGVHLYYKFGELIDVKTWSKLQEGIIKFFDREFNEYNIDKAVKDATRISRILGTYNQNKMQISRVYEVSDRVYEPEEIKKVISSRKKGSILDKIFKS